MSHPLQQAAHMNKPRIIDKQTQKHIDRFLKGKDAWNEWAEDMLTKRATSEAEKPWKLKDGFDSFNRNRIMSAESDRPEIQDWLDEAYVDFSQLYFQVEKKLYNILESEEFPNIKHTSNIPVIIPNTTVNFSNFTFPHDITFNKTLFQIPVHFRETLFQGHVVFIEAKFKQATIFCNAQFKNIADFSKTQFQRYANFHSTRFFSQVIFTATEFSDITIFDLVQFADIVTFIKAKFKTPAHFKMTKFQGTTNFKYTTFEKSADFTQAKFIGPAHFNNTEFKNHAVFIDTQFSASASFIQAQFSDVATFISAQFQGKAKFMSSRFFGPAYFREVSFHTEVSFHNTIFKNKAIFKETKFTGPAEFNEIEFEDLVDFNAAHLSGLVNFNKAKFHTWALFRKTLFQDSLLFEGASSQGIIDFSDAIFSSFIPDFTLTDYSKPLKLDGAQIHNVVHNKPKFDLPSEDPRPWGLKWISIASNRETTFHYRQIKKIAIEEHDHLLELTAFIGEMKSRRFWIDKPFSLKQGAISFWLGLCYGGLCNWGLSVFRPLLFSFLLLISCTVAYEKIADRTNCHNNIQLSVTEAAFTISLKNSLLFINLNNPQKLHRSFACLYGRTPLYGNSSQYDLLPFTFSSKGDYNLSYKEQTFPGQKLTRFAPNIPFPVSLLSVFQSILSLILIFLCGLGLRNKFRIK